MGIDVSICRKRVGLFTSSHGGGVMVLPYVTNCSELVKVIGAVSFIRSLLVIAGVEPNPGPQDKLIFRYEYLLIEVGTKMLRMLFDKMVGNDFMLYLNTNSTDYKQLKYLINKGIITDEQEKVLPPIDKTPTAANFDITLLTCLLRNVCGMRGRNDPVWKTPATGDLSVEADITRLRMSRNNLLHSGTVFVDESVFTDKWRDLCEILNRLSTSCGMTNLASLINNAKSMELDEELMKRYEETLKAWNDSEKLFEREIENLKLEQSELKADQSELKRDLSKMEDGQSQLQTKVSVMQESLEKIEECQTQSATKRQIDNLEQSIQDLKRSKSYDDAGFRDNLKKSYEKNCHTLKVLPLCGDDEDKMELLKIYQPPTLHHLPYLRDRQKEGNYPISSYKEIFLKNDKCFRNIYVTGDVGVGKTSFCQCMSLLWCLSLSGEKIDNDIQQKDVDFMAKFNFVFYVSLTETDHEDIIDMIIDEYFYTKSRDGREERIQSIEKILQEKDCLIILDGLDEWKPNTSGRKKCALPRRIPSETCTYLTTCRPYKLENMRLSNNDIDHQVQMTGIHKQSSERYIKQIVQHINKINHADKNANDFLREVKECGLADQISIPMIASQLVALWYRQKLTDMSRALIYSKIVDMLFERAEMKAQIELSMATVSELKLPDCFAELAYLNKYASLLGKLCSLSFNFLFQQNRPVLVFTKHQLMSEPYTISSEEMNFLCKLGILSKSKFIGDVTEQEQKLSFLHTSYHEFLAAFYVYSFDHNNLFDDVIEKWTTLNDVLQYDSFFLLLSGFLCHKIQPLFEKVYHTISGDLSLCRRNAIFHYDCDINRNPYQEQIVSLQNIVFNCFNEVRRSKVANLFLELEDFIFHHDADVETLRKILSANTSCVKSIHSLAGKHYEEFDQISDLQCLNIGRVMPADYAKFNRCMLNNQSALRTVCIHGTCQLIKNLTVRSLQHVTSLSLSEIKMPHNILQRLMKFLSDNVRMENIKLYRTFGRHARDANKDITYSLNLQKHEKLTSLCLYDVDILCNNINTSCLQYVTLWPRSDKIVRSYVGVFGCIRDSKLEHLYVSGYNMLDYNTMKSLTSAVTTLANIKSLTLVSMSLSDDTVLLLHPDVSEVRIGLDKVIMSRECFHGFIESVAKNKSMIKVELRKCKIRSVDGKGELSHQESVDYMYEFLTSMPTVHVDEKGYAMVHMTTNCR